MKILVLGAGGQVGWELLRTLDCIGQVIPVTRTGSPGIAVDLTDLSPVNRVLIETAPDLVVNAAAYTAVDQAEEEPALAMSVNAELPALLAQWAAKKNKTIVHYSTDYVFDGAKSGAYLESDAPNPLGVYGRSKLAGDRALLESGCTALIFRVSWIYSQRGNNFLLTMKKLMQERDSLNIVDDQVGAPTWSRSIAEITAAVIARLPVPNEEREALSGTYHLAPGGRTSWYGFAEQIQTQLGLDCRLEPITTEQYPTPAKRPKNSVLDSEKLKETFNLAMPDWQHILGLCLER